MRREEGEAEHGCGLQEFRLRALPATVLKAYKICASTLEANVAALAALAEEEHADAAESVDPDAEAATPDAQLGATITRARIATKNMLATAEASAEAAAGDAASGIASGTGTLCSWSTFINVHGTDARLRSISGRSSSLSGAPSTPAPRPAPKGGGGPVGSYGNSAVR